MRPYIDTLVVEMEQRGKGSAPCRVIYSVPFFYEFVVHFVLGSFLLGAYVGACSEGVHAVPGGA